MLRFNSIFGTVCTCTPNVSFSMIFNNGLCSRGEGFHDDLSPPPAKPAPTFEGMRLSPYGTACTSATEPAFGLSAFLFCACVRFVPDIPLPLSPKTPGKAARDKHGCFAPFWRIGCQSRMPTTLRDCLGHLYAPKRNAFIVAPPLVASPSGSTVQ